MEQSKMKEELLLRDGIELGKWEEICIPMADSC